MLGYQVRDYTPEDRAMVEGWHHGHHTNPPLEAILPKLGVVTEKDGEPMSALWLYMDNSVGVCFPEHAITRPGLSITFACMSMVVALNFLKQTASAMNYGIMLVNTLPGIARILKHEGFVVASERKKITMLGLTEGRLA